MKIVGKHIHTQERKNCFNAVLPILNSGWFCTWRSTIRYNIGGVIDVYINAVVPKVISVVHTIVTARFLFVLMCRDDDIEFPVYGVICLHTRVA